jgi:hypothetical protein
VYNFIFRESEVFQTLEFNSSIEHNIIPVILNAGANDFWLGINAFCQNMNEDKKRCVFITAGPSTKLFTWGGGGTWEDMCYERRRAEACVD